MACEGPGTTRHLVLYRNRGHIAGFFPGRAMPQLGRDCDRTFEILLDVDGDGVVNIFRPVRNPYQERFQFFQPFETAPAWAALMITATTAAWVEVPMSAFPPRWGDPDRSRPSVPGDFSLRIEADAVGLTDFCAAGTCVTLPNVLSRGGVTPLVPIWQFKVLDWNGDGLSDLLTFEGDANGVPSGPSRVALYVNRGAGFTRAGFALGTSHTLDNYAFYRATVIDWDADGRQDLLVPVGDPLQQAPQMVLFRATGRAGPFEPIALGGTLFNHAMPITADFDGDGDSDVLIPETEHTLSYIRATTHVAHLLQVAEDGIGKRDQIRYARSLDGDVDVYSFTRDCVTAMTHCARRVSPLVAKTELLQRKTNSVGQDLVSLVRRSAFTYQNARDGLHGRGRLGFARIIRFDDEPLGRLATTTTTTFDNSTFQESLAGTTARSWYPFAGHALQATTRYGSATDLFDRAFSRVDSVDFRPLAIQLSVDARPFVVARQTAQQTTESQHGRGQIVFRAAGTRLFDGYGNKESETIEWRNASSQVIDTRTSKETFTTDATARASWLIRCSAERSETSTAGGETRTRTVREAPCLAPDTPTRITREPRSTDASVFLDLGFRYDRFGNPKSIVATDRAGVVGRVGSYDYDARGLTLTRSVDGNTLETKVAFDPVHGGVLSETAPNGVTRTTSYDALARPVSVVTPDGATTLTYEMLFNGTQDPVIGDAARLRIRRTESGSDQTEIILDALGRSIQTRSAGYFDAIVTQERTYDYAGRVIYQSAAHLPGSSQGSTSFEYDRIGRLRFERRTDESASGGVAVTRWRYGPAFQGNQDQWNSATKARAIRVVEHTAPSGAVELRGLDHHGETVVARDAHGSVTQYKSGAFGVPIEIRDSAGNVTSFQHDLLGRRTVLRDPDLGTEVSTYDPYSEVKTARDATGAITSFAYDLLGRPKSRAESDGTSRTYRYDGPGTQRGQLIEAVTLSATRAVTTRINYNYMPIGIPGAGKLQTVTRTIGSETFATRMDYDAHGRLHTLHYPGVNGGRDTFAVRHEYDARGHLTKVLDPESGAAYWSLAASDQGYRIGRERLGDGTETSWTYQPLAGRIAGVETRRLDSASTLLQKLSFGYDAREELATRNDHLDRTRSRRYEHDLLGRLTRVVRQHGNGAAAELERFAYDKLGNITSRSSLGNYTYGSNKPHAVTRAGATTYVYDARGNQTLRTGPSVASGRQQIAYTSFGMPSRITTGAGNKQSVMTFTYDADQRRAYTRTNPGSETWYVGEIYERERTANSISHRYRVYGPGRVVAEVVRQQTAPSQPLGPRITHYLHPDGVGSPDLITDGGGAVVARPQFEPFGNQSSASKGVVTGFTGHRQAELGLIDMRGRFYDPVLGRFLSPDPIISNPFSSQSLNRYSYVQNRPLRLTDPSGWQPVTQPSEVQGPITKPSQVDEPRTRSSVGDTIFLMPLDADSRDLGPQGEGAGAGGQGDSGASGVVHNTAGNGNGAGAGRGDARPASAGSAIAASAAGLTVGAGIGIGVAYGLAALAAVCAPCAVVVGVVLITVAAYELYNGGAKSLYDSGSRIVHGEGTTSDYFTVSNFVGGIAAGAAKPGFGPRAPRAGGGGSGPWVPSRVRKGGAVAQTHDGSCGAACVEMLSGGTRTQAQVLGEIGEWADIDAVVGALGPGWEKGFFGSGRHALSALSGKGPMGAMLWAPMDSTGHFVVIQRGPAGFLVRDPKPGVSYTVSASWIKKWVAAGIWRL